MDKHPKRDVEDEMAEEEAAASQSQLAQGRPTKPDISQLDDLSEISKEAADVDDVDEYSGQEAEDENAAEADNVDSYQNFFNNEAPSRRPVSEEKLEQSSENILSRRSGRRHGHRGNSHANKKRHHTGKMIHNHRRKSSNDAINHVCTQCELEAKIK